MNTKFIYLFIHLFVFICCFTQYQKGLAVALLHCSVQFESSVVHAELQGRWVDPNLGLLSVQFHMISLVSFHPAETFQ